MLTAQSPEILGNLYGMPDEFTFPRPYSVNDLRIDMGEHRADVRWYTGHPFQMTPWEAMQYWATSLPGQHQANQTARFADFHANMSVPRSLSVKPDSPEANLARHAMLNLMASEDDGWHDTRPHSNIHTIGHSAIYFKEVDEALNHMRLDGINPDDVALALQQTVHHDAPETLHPGTILACGGALGDIATGGKTQADKDLEKRILEHQLAAIYGDAYSAEQRAAMVRFIRHDTDAMTPSELAMHTLAEFAHDITHRETAANLWERAWDDHYLDHWKMLKAARLVYDVHRYTEPKIEEARKAFPEMRDYIDWRARRLNVAAEGHSSFRQPNGRTITMHTMVNRWDKQRATKLAKTA